MVVGIDIGGTSFKYGLVSDDGKILSQDTIMVDKSLSGEEMINKLVAKMKPWLDSHKDVAIAGIGIGCPGSINSKTGYCDYSNNLRWEALDVCGIISRALGYPTKITNDANAATLGEFYFGAGRNYKNIIMLTLGTGVGGGIIIDGKLYEGNEGKGAELGHTVIVRDGLLCTCGRRGCYECYASTTALIRITKEKMPKHKESMLWKLALNDLANVNGKIIFEASRANDLCANEALDEYIMGLGEGILNYCSIFKPEAIILGGGISFQGEYLSDKVDAYVKKYNYGFGLGPKVDIKTAVLGNDAGIIGAACLLMDR